MPASDTDISPRVLDVLRFAVPWDAAVAVIGAETDGLGMRLVAPFVPDGTSPDDVTDDDALARLAALRAEGYEFLIAGASAFGWLDGRPRLKEQLEQRHRLVDRSPDACAVYALHDQPTGPASDGLPLPPADMIRMTAGMYRRASDAEALYRRYDVGGTKIAAVIGDLLSRTGADVAGMDALLDFGCGCGRVVRHWADASAEVHGSDYNPNFVRWCADNLPFAQFAVNDAAPPLPYEDDSFDFLYSISIFTHLDEPLQLPWINELTRVTRPGGLMLITVSGDVHARRLPGWEGLREPFEAGQLVVRRAERAGSNACSVLHPPEYVRDTLTRGLEVLAVEPGVQAIGWQDAILIRTPER